VGLLSLLAVLAQAPAGSGDVVALRVCDRVDDTIDAAQRDSLGLFPGVPGFVRARFVAGPDSEAYAIVDYDLPEGRASAYLPLSPTQLKRISYLACNAESVRHDTVLNVYAGLAVRRFWGEVELASFQPSLGGGGEATPDWRGKAYTALHGATVGSAVGGCAASWIAARRVQPGYQIECTCLPAIYRVSDPLFCGITGGTTLLGVAGGLGLAGGEASDMFEPDLTSGGGWRTGIAAGLMTIPGIAVGALFAYLAHNTLYGRELKYGVDEWNESGWRWVPAVFTGACITVEFAALGYKWGSSWGQARIRRAARTGYALTRQPAEADTAHSHSR